MSERSALGGFTPFNDAHAIVTSSLTIQFAGPVPDEAWPALRQAIHSAGRECNLGSPEPFFHTSITFDATRIGVNFNSPPANSMDVSGLSFSRLDEDDIVVERLVGARDHIQITTNAYIRWAPFFARASEFISNIFHIYADHLVLSAVKLEYWDRFDFTGEGQPSLDGLLQLSSPWIAACLAEEADSAHSYSGRFDRLNDKLRRLSNIRIDYGDYPTKGGGNARSAIIHTMLQDAANAPGYEATDRNAYGVNDVLGLLEGQHLALKELLRGIITREAGARIGL